ncbi:MAG: hypothetical protein DRP99_04800, partial [Candidatus Latescibacterota bacterium]
LLRDAISRKGVDPELKAEGERLLDLKEVCPSFTEYTHAPEVLEARRGKVGELLERLNRGG